MMDAELETEEKLVVEEGQLSEIDSDDEENQDEFLQAVFDIHEIIDLLKNNKVESLESIKGCLLNIDVILDYFQKEYSSLASFSEFKKYLGEAEKRITELIKQDVENEEVVHELEVLLEKVQNYYRTASSEEKIEPATEPVLDEEVVVDQKPEGSDQVVILQPESEDPNLVIDSLDFPEIDALYQQLYDAIASGDVKKETTYRGRIIRKLRKNEDLIQEKYDKVEVISDIVERIKDTPTDILHTAREVLLEPQNKDYYDYFASTLHSEAKFIDRLNTLCQRSEIQKIYFYHSALRDELKQQGKKLDERYSKEFLDKRAGLTSLVTTLPTAVGLSVQKFANTIREAQNAKTNRKKVSKTLESIKDAGIVLATPVIYLGKFVINNWYALYKVFKGYQDAKILEEERIAAETKAKEEQSTAAKEKASAEKQALEEARAKAAEESKTKAAESRKALEEARLRAEAEERAREAERARVAQEAEREAKAKEAAEARKNTQEALQRETREFMEESRKHAEAVEEARAEKKDPEPSVQPSSDPAPQSSSDPNYGSSVTGDGEGDYSEKKYIIMIPSFDGTNNAPFPVDVTGIVNFFRRNILGIDTDELQGKMKN